MLLWARRVFDVKAGEGLPVALTFVYIALVVCAFLLAKPIRNALFLKQYGPYALVYVYAAVPAVLAVFVPIYSGIAARFGSRASWPSPRCCFSAPTFSFSGTASDFIGSGCCRASCMSGSTASALSRPFRRGA